jgi:hypothetical protein
MCVCVCACVCVQRERTAYCSKDASLARCHEEHLQLRHKDPIERCHGLHGVLPHMSPTLAAVKKVNRP